MNNKFTIRGVRPSISSNQKAEELIENKYLSFGVDSYLKISKPSKFYYLTFNYYANKSYSHSFKRKYRIYFSLENEKRYLSRIINAVILWENNDKIRINKLKLLDSISTAIATKDDDKFISKVEEQEKIWGDSNFCDMTIEMADKWINWIIENYPNFK